MESTDKPVTVDVSRPSKGTSDRYRVGLCQRYQGWTTGGGPDGCYWTVVAKTGRWQDEQTYRWMVGATLRPATAEEAAPVHARRLAQQEVQ